MEKADSSGTEGETMKISDIKYNHLIAGVSGGVVSTAVLHPLDLIKIRLQGQWT